MTFPGYTEARSIIRISDGGLALVLASDDLHPVKTDPADGIEWGPDYGNDSWQSACASEKIWDGGYIIAGESANGDMGYFPVLVRTDSSGEALWSSTYLYQEYQSPYPHRPASVHETGDGGYTLAGLYDCRILRLAPRPGAGEESAPAPVEPVLTASCNPFASTVTIACEGSSLPGQLSVYDTRGVLSVGSVNGRARLSSGTAEMPRACMFRQVPA